MHRATMALPPGRGYERAQAANARPRRRHAVTAVEVLVVAAVILLLAALVVALRSGRRHDGIRTPCAGNLSEIGKGVYTYATENNDEWPIANHMPAEADEVGRVRYAPGSIGAKRGSATDPKAGESTAKDEVLSTTRNLWTLIRTGGASPRSFFCPSSQDSPNRDDDPTPFWDFGSYREVSYGYQVPYGKHGKPTTEGDPRMPLAADKGPYGAALEAGAANPGVPKLRLDATPDDWMSWNSPNHGGEGQVVLFVDSHVEFLPKPIVGVENDNIYTRWSTADGGGTASNLPRVQGTPPTGIETPWSNTDSLIYP
jgi:hypothetical protein